ncbi:hypothetical protein TELCIR_05077 [Teladorsagia circumcincta]|uniref:EH domain-containing protein n=1 Tax=Teladorsagia circumcincta TaxID=45464 RepID=A0A2G9URU7_TELCI|nr:hypothetical protein TELCIR_05077 [Teladorsagia circumcincta]
MMGGGGGVVPPVLLDEARVPRFYRDAIAACGATQQNMLPHTALVYNLMVTSGLPRPVLSYIWSAVNRTLPGQLTRPEFFSCLALIALAQSVQVPLTQPLAPPVVNVARPVAPPAKEQRQGSSFIPTSLLMGRRSNTKKKEVDLMGEALPPSAKSPSQDEGGMPSPILPPPIPGPSKSGHQSHVTSNFTNGLNANSNSAMNDLCSIDWSSMAPTQAASASHDLNSPTTGSSRSDEDVSTASSFSMACSTASEINGSAQMTHPIGAELLECWEKVIAAATGIFKTADRLLASASDDVIREIAQTERGDGYLRCLNHLYFVVCRVERSAKSELPKGCRQEIDYCTRIWKRLVDFIEDPEEEDRAAATEK